MQKREPDEDNIEHLEMQRLCTEEVQPDQYAVPAQANLYKLWKEDQDVSRLVVSRIYALSSREGEL